jgi:hypothetical protein
MCWLSVVEFMLSVVEVAEFVLTFMAITIIFCLTEADPKEAIEAPSPP